MSQERNDQKEAVDEASAIVEEARIITVTIPLGDVYNLGNAVAMAAAAEREEGNKGLARDILRKLETVVPKELIQEGRDVYSEDLSVEVPISVSYNEIEFIGQTVLASPGGREIITSLPIDRNDRAELDGFRNSFLTSFLILHKTFVEAGGKNNEIIMRGIEEALS